MSTDNPVVYADVVKTEPDTREEFAAGLGDDFDEEAIDEAYSNYLARHQPWRIVLLRDGNFEPLFRSTESYFNRADAYHAIDVSWGPATTVFRREAEHGNVLIRQGLPASEL